MNPRHIAFIAYETLRAFKRVVDPKSADPYWYDIEDPDEQAAFQELVDRALAGQTPAQLSNGSDLDHDRVFLLSAVVHSLATL